MFGEIILYHFKFKSFYTIYQMEEEKHEGCDHGPNGHSHGGDHGGHGGHDQGS